jgi:hypothetical protein
VKVGLSIMHGPKHAGFGLIKGEKWV